MPTNPATPETTGDALADAKTRLRSAARSIAPLAPLRNHPFTTVGVALASGYVIGTGNHDKIIKVARLTVSLGNLLRPALMAASSFAVNHFAQASAATATAPDQTS